MDAFISRKQKQRQSRLKTKDSIIAKPLSTSTYLTRLRLVVPGTFFLVPTQPKFHTNQRWSKNDVNRLHNTDWLVSDVSVWVVRASCSPKSTLWSQTVTKSHTLNSSYTNRFDARHCCAVCSTYKWRNSTFSHVVMKIPRTLVDTRLWWQMTKTESSRAE